MFLVLNNVRPCCSFVYAASHHVHSCALFRVRPPFSPSSYRGNLCAGITVEGEGSLLHALGGREDAAGFGEARFISERARWQGIQLPCRQGASNTKRYRGAVLVLNRCLCYFVNVVHYRVLHILVFVLAFLWSKLPAPTLRTVYPGCRSGYRPHKT